MTVAELIERLKELPAELPVCMTDWQEEYRCPHEVGKDSVCVAEGNHFRTEVKGEQYGRYVQLDI